MLGALIWGVGVTWAGAALGGVPFVHENLEVIVILIVFVSVLPMVVEIVLNKRKAKIAAAAKAGEAVADEDEVVASGIVATEVVTTPGDDTSK